MKSSNELIRYFRVFYRPTEVFSDLASKEASLAETFVIILLSSALLVAGIFIVGDAVYTTFHNYAYSYLLEIVTSGQLFGYYLPYDYYGLVVLTDIIFCIKAWLLLSLLLLLFLRLFQQKLSFKRVTQVIAWSIFPFALIMFIVSFLCLGLKFLFPAFYSYVFFAILGIIFIIIAPIYIAKFLDRLKNISIYNSFRAYYLSLFVVFVIFTLNHAEKILDMLW
jgi:hypothetical protein